MPAEAGGTGEGFLYYACMNEEIGRAHWAQLVFGCQAPDAGNAEILHQFGTEEQKAQFLEPLVAGRARSFFSMTEPDVAGSDPTLLRTRAVLDGDEWVIDGHKWFSSGAEGSTFGIVFAISDPDAETYKRGTMILVPADAPGLDDLARDVGDGPRRPRLEHPLRGALRRAFGFRSRTRSASGARRSGSPRSGSARAGSTTSCAGSGRCSGRST